MQALALALVFLAAASQDPARDLKSKDIAKRLAAVDALSADEKGEKALLSVLKDKREDWEVLTRAAAGLGAHGSAAATDELVRLALDGPVRSVRLAAAHTLGRVAAKSGAELLVRKAAGDDQLHALEALDALLAEKPAGVELKGLEKLYEKEKDPALRAAAARALVRAHGADRAEVLKRLLASESVAVQCAALAPCLDDPRAETQSVLLEYLGRARISDLGERRAVRALALLVERAGTPGLEALAPLFSARDGSVAARAARVLGALGNSFEAAKRLEALAPLLGHKEASARAAAAHALRRLGTREARARAAELLAGDREPRVRRAALESFARLGAEESEELGKVLGPRFAQEPDAGVRERLVVHLGRKGLLAAVDPLSQALSDPEWPVAVCAAVSLGRTQTGPAVDRLVRLLKESKDWKLRGAAAAGLGQSYHQAALAPLVEALADPDKAVVATAHDFLVSLTLQQLPPKPEPWRDWLAKNASKVELHDPKTRDEMARRERERGTFVDTTARERELTRVFKDLALIVLESRGDHIQTLLGRFKIQHVLTAAGKTPELALQPDALFVANCTGEIEDKDVERLSWFVRTGGHLFGSCWALTETIGRIAPGVIAKAETSSEVLDHVPAEPAAEGDDSLDGVFAPGVVPVYELQGAHLIEVLDPERAEVLVDSPLCAEHWGAGDLAAWFPLGHGIVLDSVNHFDVQGLELAEGLKTREDRQAYAVDHMGFSFADLRASREEKYWDNSLRASEKVADLSVLRLVTNFVTRWRIEVGR